jgi:hypothetical protein
VTVKVRDEVPDILALPSRAAVEVLNDNELVPDILPGAKPVKVASGTPKVNVEAPDSAVEPRSTGTEMLKDRLDVPAIVPEPRRDAFATLNDSEDVPLIAEVPARTALATAKVSVEAPDIGALPLINALATENANAAFAPVIAPEPKSTGLEAENVKLDVPEP